MDKILIVRFSSIGDIVLTSPVVRALHNLPKPTEIHFITKQKYATTLIHNPFVDKLYTFEKEITEISAQLKAENYTYVIDLHSNLRSKRLKILLGKESHSFNKINLKKWLKVNLKYNALPDIHIVDRYLQTVSFLGVENDGLGLDYFIDETDIAYTENLRSKFNDGYHVFVIGGTHFTKQIPKSMLIEIANASSLPIVLVGGLEDREKGEQIVEESGGTIVNTCGEYSLNQSAAIIKYSNKVLTSDTGMMHIASAFHKDILSLWGNTVPEFGMYPYLSKDEQNKNHIFEVKGLSCRPCSKIGYKECPKQHFNCMIKINIAEVIAALNS